VPTLIRSLLLGLLVWSAPAFAEARFGFQQVRVPDGGEPPLPVAIWYPTAARPAPVRLETFTQEVATDAPVAGRALPLVIISHGGGGSLADYYDTALALARAGFVVAALIHNGDTHGDESRVLELWRRPAQLHRVVTWLLAGWRDRDRLDPGRVGGYGFSNGGFTMLVAAGGVPDLARIDPYCRAQPGHDLCTALRLAGITSVAALPVPHDPWVREPRLRAVAVAAPGFGFTFTRGGLAGVRIPVALWRGSEDDHQPEPWYDEAVRRALPRPPEYHLVPGATHYDFLAPCSAILMREAKPICTTRRGFDRTIFHARFNAELVVFFRHTLRLTPPSS